VKVRGGWMKLIATLYIYVYKGKREKGVTAAMVWNILLFEYPITWPVSFYFMQIFISYF